MHINLDRRHVLVGTGVMAGWLLAGCGVDEATQNAEKVAKSSLRSQLSVELGLIAAYEQSGGEESIVDEHKRHATALRKLLPKDSIDPQPWKAPADLALAEQQAAEKCTQSCNRVPTRVDVAVALLASIAACERTHVPGVDIVPLLGLSDVMDGSEVSLVKAPQKSLDTTLSAEYAAIWAYGAIGAHLDGEMRILARRADNRHRARRDLLAAQMGAKKLPIPAPEAAYELPFPVVNDQDAMRLALAIEEKCGVVWLELAEVTTKERNGAIAGLGECALWAATWRRQSSISPATVPFPGAE